MEKQKNSIQQNQTQNILIGLLVLAILASTGILGSIIELVVGLVFGVVGIVVGLVGGIIGLVVGLIGGVIGLVVGLIGGVLGIVGTVIGVVLGTAIIWGPILAIVLISKSMSDNNDETPKKKKNISITD